MVCVDVSECEYASVPLVFIAPTSLGVEEVGNDNKSSDVRST